MPLCPTLLRLLNKLWADLHRGPRPNLDPLSRPYSGAFFKFIYLFILVSRIPKRQVQADWNSLQNQPHFSIFHLIPNNCACPQDHYAVSLAFPQESSVSAEVAVGIIYYLLILKWPARLLSTSLLKQLTIKWLYKITSKQSVKHQYGIINQ